MTSAEVYKEKINQPEQVDKRIDNEQCLAKAYPGIHFDVDTRLLRAVITLKKEFAHNNKAQFGVAPLDRLLILKEEDPQKFAWAESLAELMEKDDALKHIVETRREIAGINADFNYDDQQYHQADKWLSDSKKSLASDEARLAQLVAASAGQQSFSESEFKVHKGALDYMRDTRAGLDVGMDGTFGAKEMTVAGSYLDRIAGDAEFARVAKNHEECSALRLTIEQSHRKMQSAIDDKKKYLLGTQNDEALLVAAETKLGQFIRVAELVRQEAIEKLNKNPNEALATGREVEIALSKTQDLGSPRIYKVIAFDGKNIQLARANLPDSKTPDKNRVVSKSITLDDFKKSGGRPL